MQIQNTHGQRIEEVASGLQTHLENGLTQQEARVRLEQHGPNELTEKPRPGFLSMLWDQLNNYLIVILVVAALVSLSLG